MVRKKRASGEGTIRKRPNGLWEARLSISGQYRTKSFYGKTQADARRKREEARKALEAGHSLDSQRQTVGEYLNALRIRRACRELADAGTRLADVALRAGFSDQSHFTRAFKRATGMTPGAFRRTCGAGAPRAGLSGEE
jgi:YesN/AraC family two-component response regulator